MVDEPLVERAEVAARLFAIADVNRNVARIRELLEEDLGEEEDVPEDDA